MAKKALAKKEAVVKEAAKTAHTKPAAAKTAAAKTAPAKGVAKDVTAKKSSGKHVAARKVTAMADTILDENVTAKKDVASPKAVASSAKKVSPTLTTSEIGDHLAATFDIPKSHAKIYLTEAVALIGKSLKKGNKVRISGLGVFQIKKRAARKGRNPNTGEPIKIKASKRVGFAVARDLKVKL